MARRAQFSVLSIMLLTLGVALGSASLIVWNTITKTSMQLAASRANLNYLEAMAAMREKQIQSEFFGHFPPPVLAIDPKMDRANPSLVAILNSKASPQRSTHTFGSGQVSKRIRFDLRLLRSLDNKDYYRLKWGVDAALDQPADQGLTTVLFEYDGMVLTVVDNETTSIVLAPSRPAAIQAMIGLRSTEETEALRERWLNSLRVQPNFMPAVRPSPNMEEFN